MTGVTLKFGLPRIRKSKVEKAFDLWFLWYDEYNTTETPWYGKKNYKDWKKHNEQDELRGYIGDGHEDPSLY